LPLLSAKGTFRHSTGEHVGVDVKNCLTGVFSTIEHQSKIAVGVLGGKIASSGNEFSKECGVTFGEFRDIGELFGLGHDEQMHRRLRGDVTERDDSIGLENNVGRNFAINDPAEDAHVSQSIRVTSGRAGRSERRSSRGPPSTFA